MASSVSVAPQVLRHLSPAGAARLLGEWHAGGPAYLALADALRAAVLAGTLAPLTRLPSERELAAALDVSRTTTAAAYGRLRELGFAVSRVGSGTVAVLPRSGGRAPLARPVAGDAPALDTFGPGPGLHPPGIADPLPDAGRSPLQGASPDEHTGPGRSEPLDGRAGAPGRASAVGPREDVLLNLAQATPSAPPALYDAFARALEALPAYLGTGGYAHHGIEPLREAVAARYRERGVPTTAEQILVTTGAQQAITLLAQTFVGPRDPAVVESPTYYHAMESLRLAGARLVGVRAGDVEQLESAVRQTRPRLVYLVPDFHNPTGRSLDGQQRAAVRALADRYGVTIVGDETLTELALDPGSAVTGPFAGDGTSPHVVTVGSASKIFWGGLRIGWVRADPQVVERLARTRQSMDIATAILEQLAVVELLGRRAEVLPGRLAGLRERRDLVVGLLREAVPGWQVEAPPGGLCLWVGLGRPVAQAFVAAAAAEGALVNAGPVFTPDGSARDRFRLTYTRTPEELALAVPRLTRAWERVGG